MTARPQTSALTREQRQALRSIDGKLIRLPGDKRHYPSPDLIGRRYSSAKMFSELRALDA